MRLSAFLGQNIDRVPYSNNVTVIFVNYNEVGILFNTSQLIFKYFKLTSQSVLNFGSKVFSIEKIL